MTNNIIVWIIIVYNYKKELYYLIFNLNYKILDIVLFDFNLIYHIIFKINHFKYYYLKLFNFI